MPRPKHNNFKRTKSKNSRNNIDIVKNETDDEDLEIKEGRVVEALPAALFRVEFEDKSQLICFLKGKIKVFKIKILVGDKVQVELDPYGGKGRIIRRL